MNRQKFLKYQSVIGLLLVFSLFTFSSCDDDDDEPVAVPTGNEVTYDLNAVADPTINGTVTFIELDDNSTTVTFDIDGTIDGGLHPAHIHANSAAETGPIVITLNPVEGSTGQSSTFVTEFDDGTPVTYDQLLGYDGYINVHQSEDNLETILTQGDIGQNEFTGTSITYDLGSRDVAGIDGTVIFEERLSGEALATISLTGTPADGMHPAHIHMNTAAEGGGIVFTFNPVDGNTGISVTHVAEFDDGAPLLYEDVLSYDGYVNVHLSENELGTIVAQGDIGQNDLTGTVTEYDLGERDVAGISGTASFAERINGEALATLDLTGTPDGGTHPAHIHMNTAAEGGDIAFSFNPVDGNTGMSMTNVSELDDGTSFTYADVVTYDGYVNVHLSADELGTIVAQGDIGENDLTGTSITYNLDETDVPGINGTATFSERINGEALAVLDLTGTPDGGTHPAHIHMGTAGSGGAIVYTFNPVDGTTGMSRSNVTQFDNGDPLGYDDILTYDGYINVHLSANELATIVAQGNIGANAN